MKSKAMFVSFVALLAVAFALTTVSATHMTGCLTGASNDWVCITDVEVNGVSVADELAGGDFIGFDASETVPVEVEFTVLDDGIDQFNDGEKDSITDVRVKAYIDGFKEDIEDETSRFHVLEGNTYVKKLSLKLPSTMDLDELSSEELALLVRISARSMNSLEVEVPLEVQKELYDLEILSIDRPEVVSAGELVDFSVVVRNNGFDRLDNVYVTVTIPGLGVSKKVYAGDLASMRDEFDDDVNDAREKVVSLRIPSNAAAGNYEVEVTAESYDATAKETTRIVVRNVEPKVLPPVTAKTVAPGKDASFDVTLFNPSNRMVVYTITAQGTQGFMVEATEPSVVVGPESSRTTKVNVRASDAVEEGTYVITVTATSDAGVTEQIPFTVNVKKEAGKTTGGVVSVTDKPNTVVVITVILVIVFVVLLIILIVLLTKRPTESEEFGETNYY
jgi:uncharacterized membrane protein